MSLKEVYTAYLADPAGKSIVLSDDASLKYITTLTTINGATAINKHHAAHEKALKRKEQKILDHVEGGLSLSVDVEITLEFLTGGGAYLPGIDDNFVSDHVVTFPMIHVVHFNAERQITQIRLYWDQGSLLKQIDVIGARGRNWPIRDGKDQARLVATSTKGAPASESSVAANIPISKPRAQSNNVTRDPHASLALFMSAEENSAASPPKAIAPRASASTKTAARDYHDLFGAPDSDIHGSTANPTKPSANKENISTKPSPSKSNAGPPTRDLKDLFGDGHDADSSPHEGAHAASPEKNILSPGGGAPKVGASKHYKPIRLFETEGEESNEAGSLSKSIYKPDPKRFQHFEFGHGDEVSVDQTPRPKTKHQTQWDFEDFQTPVRPTNRKSNHPNRSFSLENDDPVTEKPPRVPAAAKGRPDANPHFEFQDDGAVAGERPYGQPRGAGSVRMTGLYQDHVFDGDRPPSPDKSKPLAPVTNLQDRRKDFDAHFAMTDSPSGNGFPADSEKAVPEARKKVVNAMAAHWSASDESPGSGMNGNTSNSGNKENINTVGAPTHVGIKSGGDGMGGKKGTSRQWGFGDESDGEHPVFRPERKSHVPKDNNIWDF